MCKRKFFKIGYNFKKVILMREYIFLSATIYKINFEI